MKIQKIPEPKDMLGQILKENDLVQVNPPNKTGVFLAKVINVYPRSCDLMIIVEKPYKVYKKSSRTLLAVNEKLAEFPEAFI